MTAKARILFVDDEKRVLNSMRGLFRREFELFLTTEGSDAIRIAEENAIDVVVADQRMPGMTGIEVLGKVKELSPKTVRILLTGYADPEAVEGSINIGEVFRFLSKPCPPQVLRDTLKLAVAAAQTVAPRDTRDVSPEPETKVLRPPDEPRVPEPVRPPFDKAHAVASAGISNGIADSADRPAIYDGDEVPTLAPIAKQYLPAPARRERAATPAAVAPAYPGSNGIPILEPAEKVNPTATVVLEPAQTEGVSAADDKTFGSRTEESRPKAARLFESAQSDTSPIRDAPVPSHWQNSTTIVLSGDTSHEFPVPNFNANTTPEFNKVGIVFFTVDPGFAETAMRAASGERSVTLATTLAKVAETIEKKEAGVLVTDFTSNSALLQRMISTLKQMLPELVTIVASDGRDTTDMINLINHGQVFRYVLKPIEPKKLMYEINAAAIKHLDLVDCPDLAIRHRVVDMTDSGVAEDSLSNFLRRIRNLRHEQTGS